VIGRAGLSSHAIRLGLVGLLLSANTGCGAKKDLGADLEISVLPSSVIVAPGDKASCIDISDGIRDGNSPNRSVKGPFVYYPKFVLYWKSPDKFLYVSGIRVTVRGSGITGGETKGYIQSDEVIMLLGSDVIPPNSISVSTMVTAERPSSQYLEREVKCGLSFGGISLVENAENFRARVKVDVIGTAAKEDFSEQEFVLQSFEVKADYYQF
jgi:hypothetical protein